MARLENKALFFTTSPRTPIKMIPEIKLLCENFSNKKWNKDTQISFIDKLIESGFFEGSGSDKYKDFSARDRINRAPKALGFVNLSPEICLTGAGKELVYGKRPQEIFLRQLLKFQLPSPYHKENSQIEGTFFIKPYLEILRLVRELQYLTFDELKVFALRLTDFRDYELVKNNIIKFRHEKKNNNVNYKKFIDDIWTNIIYETYKDNICSGDTKTRETKDDSIKKFITTKKSNDRDYTDACFRYLRYTGLVSISNTNRSISIYEDKFNEIDFILNTVNREPVFVDDEIKYKEYLFNSTIPSLYTDNKPNIIDYILKISNYTKRQLSDKDINELKDLKDEIVKQRKDAVIKNQITEIKSYSLYSEIIDTYNEIIANGYYDNPLMLEYNTWRAMTMLNGGTIKGNFNFDDFGQPLSTAAGNMADIECYYDDFNLTVEVTMQQGQRQYEMEGEPVARHFGQMKKKSGKDTYCLFIAPTINNASLAHFYALNKIGISYYGGKTKIIPLEIDLFMQLVENAYNYKIQPKPNNIRDFLDKAMEQEELSVDENDWYSRIRVCTSEWLAA